jgi:hypothetical protein
LQQQSQMPAASSVTTAGTDLPPQDLIDQVLSAAQAATAVEQMLQHTTMARQAQAQAQPQAPPRSKRFRKDENEQKQGGEGEDYLSMVRQLETVEKDASGGGKWLVR